MKTTSIILPLIALLFSMNYAFATLSVPDAENILKEFTYTFKNDINRAGKRYFILRKWDENKFDMSIKTQDQDKLILKVTKGAISNKFMTKDSFRLILCHEFGHFFGGAPKTKKGNWASNEGQSDYYSTAKCIRRIIPEEADFKQRVQTAILALGKLYAESRNEDPNKISLEAKDMREVNQTVSTHPDAQCRVDTMVAGLNCPISDSIEFSDQDEKIGACLDSSVDETIAAGARPRCWFRPQVLGKVCESLQLVPGQKIPLISVSVKKYKDDSTGEMSVRVGINVPQNSYTNKVARSEKNSRFETFDKKALIANGSLLIDQKLFMNYLQKSILPIKPQNITLKQQGSSFAFEVKCRDL